MASTSFDAGISGDGSAFFRGISGVNASRGADRLARVAHAGKGKRSKIGVGISGCVTIIDPG